MGKVKLNTNLLTLVVNKMDTYTNQHKGVINVPAFFPVQINQNSRNLKYETCETGFKLYSRIRYNCCVWIIRVQFVLIDPEGMKVLLDDCQSSQKNGLHVFPQLSVINFTSIISCLTFCENILKCLCHAMSSIVLDLNDSECRRSF